MSNAGINRRLPIEVTDSLVKRHANHVDQAGPDDCWNWNAGFRNGYGAIKHQGRVLSAHRVAYVIAYGEPEDGLIIGHTCDNRACCNPRHLEAITPGQNIRDSYERGDVQVAKGEEKPGAVLTEQLVAQAWAMKQSGKSCPQIAATLGVKATTLKNVLSGRSWKHLTPAWAKN